VVVVRPPRHRLEGLIRRLGRGDCASEHETHHPLPGPPEPGSPRSRFAPLGVAERGRGRGRQGRSCSRPRGAIAGCFGRAGLKRSASRRTLAAQPLKYSRFLAATPLYWARPVPQPDSDEPRAPRAAMRDPQATGEQGHEKAPAWHWPDRGKKRGILQAIAQALVPKPSPLCLRVSTMACGFGSCG
jgi:hypothetical protein